MNLLENIESDAGIAEIESAYKAFFKNSKDALSIMEAAGPDLGRIRIANLAAAQMHGYSLEEFLKLNALDLDSDAEAFQSRLQRLRDGESLAFQVTHHRKDGTQFPVDVSANCLSVNGQPYLMTIERDISERKITEQWMRDRNKFIQSIASASPDVIYVYDLEAKRIVYANHHIADWLGYEPNEARRMGKDFLRLLSHPEDLAELPYLLGRLENAGKSEVLEAEYRVKHKSGEWRWLHSRNTVFRRNEAGNVTQIIGTARDKTDSKLGRLALEQSLSLLNATLESTEDGILVVAKSGKISAHNQKFLNLWSIPVALAEEKDDAKLLAFVLAQVADPDAFLLRVQELYDQEKLESEDFVEFKDGRIFERYSKPQVIGEEVVGRVWSFRDVTNRIQKEKSLSESDERFKRLMEASFGGIAIHDQGKIIDANHGLSLITGYSFDELVAMDGLQLIVPEYREHVIQKIRAGHELPFDVLGLRKDGTRYHLEIHGKNIPFQNRKVGVTEFRDISNRKLIEKSIREQNIRLSSIAENLTRKNAQLEEFTQIVSHNLRSPAGNINSLLDLFGNGTPEEQKEYFRHLQDSSQILLNTLKHLNDVLRFKQDKNIERHQLKFEDVFNDVCRMVRAKIDEVGADVKADFHEAPEISYPSIYLESVLLNLIGNALKYHSPKRKPIVRLRSYFKGKKLILEVRDNGLGINLVKYGHHMFKMRKTFHDHPESQGLGLFLVKNQVESMGGEITLQSEENKGATFIINFNRYEV